MNITVFGASGRVGSQVVELLLSDGHKVTAFVHGKHSFSENNNLVIVQGDIYNAENVENAVKGAEAVVSALGSWGTKKKNVLTEGMRAIIPAMKKSGCNRIISLTGAGAYDSEDSPSVIDKLNHFALAIIASKILRDGEEHMKFLRASGLNWTVVRSPVMKANGKRGYRLVEKAPLPWETIEREDVVAAMTQMLYDGLFLQKAPFIRRK